MTGRPPRATYRVQLHAGFDFDAAARQVPYLAELGISHLYVSPILQAVPGSRHGYDVVDHGRISEELGGSAGFDRLADALAGSEMGLVVDIVPNHMAIVGHANRWWWDVLEHGPASRFADWFDVDWDPPESRLRNVILLPVLEDHYGRMLEAGRIKLARDAAGIEVRYAAQRFPLDPRSLADLVGSAARRSGSAELAFIGRALGELPPATTGDRLDLVRRRQDAAVLDERLAALAGEPEVAEAIDAVIAALNDDHDALDQLLEEQNYRLAYWRASSRDLGYRRFFDINSLIGIRVEREDVFLATHRLILDLVAAGRIQGLRIDHPDGLRDPAGYFERLRAGAPEAWIVAEKILEADETLPPWPVDGTTGYAFAAAATQLMIDPGGLAKLDRHWREVAPELAAWPEIARDARHQALTSVLGSDLNRLTDLLLGICEANRRYRDFTRHELHEALREFVVALDVYRTYVRSGEPVADADRSVIRRAATVARERRPDLDAELFALVEGIALLEMPGRLSEELAVRLQQLTPAVMAKGIEDTAMYRYLRLTALNEVGADPSTAGGSASAFHAAMERAERSQPAAMLTTSTHDTKRSEDVRARIGLLSELPDAWAAVRGVLADRAGALWSAPEPIDAVLAELLVQTVAGTWPIAEGRLREYLVKASREAGLRTGWTAPDEEYEAAIARLTRDCLGDPGFVSAIDGWAVATRERWRAAALGTLVLKLVAPGVPDIYQGTELWDDSLVDPDNRRPVDFARRASLLHQLSPDPDAETVLASGDEGLPKLWVIREALALRKRRPAAFAAAGEYRPLPVDGPSGERVVAFARGGEVVCVVPRVTERGSPDGWSSTRVEMPSGRWRDLFGARDWDGGAMALSDLLARFPVALLERAP